MTSDKNAPLPDNSSHHPLEDGKIALLDDPSRFGRIWFTSLLIMFGLFLLIPDLDLWLAGKFLRPDGKFAFGEMPSLVFIHENVDFVLWAAFAVLLLISLYRYFRDRTAMPAILRQWILVVASALIGPGIVANLIFKEFWGRARPVQILEFGGTLKMTPPLVISDQCASNCSFVGGDASLGYWLFIFGFMTSGAWRIALMVLAALVGTGLGVIRMGQGAHFLSDIIFAGWIMFGVCFIVDYVFSARRTYRQHLDAILCHAARWLRDFKHITKPRRGETKKQFVRKLPYFLTLVLVIVMLFDIPLSHAAHQLSPDWRRFFSRLSDIALGEWYLVGMPLIALFMVPMAFFSRILKWRDHEKQLIEFLFVPGLIFASVIASGFVTNVIKFILARTRPELYFNATTTKAQFGLDFFNHKYLYASFPSGHATTAFAVATCLWLLWPRYATYIWAFGIIVAVSRVLAWAHWPSDIVAGGFIGYLSTIMVHRWLSKLGLVPARFLPSMPAFPAQPIKSVVKAKKLA